MKPVEARLRELLPDERIRVLENTRFDPGETKNDPEFARELADELDLYVNDAFGSAHRAHASTVGVAELLPAYAGPAARARAGGARASSSARSSGPFVLISGGAKVDDKLGVLREPRRQGRQGADRRQDGRGDPRREPAGRSRSRCPTDVVAASEFAEDAEAKVVPYDELPRRVARARHRARDAGDLRGRDRARRGRSSGTGRWASSSGRASPRARRPLREAVAKVDAHTVVGGADSVRALDRDGPRRRGRLGLDRRRRFPRAPGRERIAGRGSDPGGVVPHRAIHAGPWPAITRRQSPPSLSPILHSVLPSSECGLWLGARDPGARRHHWKGHRMLIAGNWKMYKGPAETAEFCVELRRSRRPRGRRRRRLPALHVAGRDRAGAGRHRHRRRGPERPLGRGGRVHRRGLGADAARARCLRSDRRPFRATPVLRRDGRDSSPSGRAPRSTLGCP